MAVRGAPKRAGHALLSTLFSLFPTLDAHCIVTTHYILPSPPCSFFQRKTPLRHCPQGGFALKKRFAPRCFHALLNALSSPRGALTAVFGMGTGVSPPPVARTKGIGSGRLVRGTALSAPCNVHADPGRVPPGRLSAALHAARPRPPHRGGDRGRAASRPHGLSEAVW